MYFLFSIWVLDTLHSNTILFFPTMQHLWQILPLPNDLFEDAKSFERRHSSAFCWVCLYTSSLPLILRFSLREISNPTRFGTTRWEFFSFIRVILFLIEVQCKHKILQTLARPTLNLIGLIKMHFLVKVQLFHSEVGVEQVELQWAW